MCLGIMCLAQKWKCRVCDGKAKPDTKPDTEPDTYTLHEGGAGLGSSMSDKKRLLKCHGRGIFGAISESGSALESLSQRRGTTNVG